MSRHLLLLFACFSLTAACASADDPEVGDGRDDAFVQSRHDRADAFGLGADEIATILHHVNTLTEVELDVDVALDRRAARNIVLQRDVAPIKTLEELDAVPYVGTTAFDKLRAYAAAHPVSLAACGNGILEPSEQCDDANALGFDGCSATCNLEVARLGTGYDMPNIGGFRRFDVVSNFTRQTNSGSREFGVEARSPISLSVRLHDGQGGVPQARFQDRYGNLGTQNAKLRFVIDELAPNQGTRVLDTTEAAFDIDLPAGRYRLRQLPPAAAESSFETYDVRYTLEIDVLGDVAECLRPGCDASSYTVPERNGTRGYPVDQTGDPSRTTPSGFLYPSAWEFAADTLNVASNDLWPIDVGQTQEFAGTLSRERKKYFLFRIERPTSLKIYGVEVLDWSAGLGGAYLAEKRTRLYRHDPTKRSPGYAMAAANTYTLEPGYYVYELVAGASWLKNDAVRTTFKAKFVQSPL